MARLHIGSIGPFGEDRLSDNATFNSFLRVVYLYGNN